MSVNRRLRVALWTWSRRDRAASGDVAVDTALDLIDAGGSVGREARSLARTGLTLRIRGTFRDLRTAPWRASLPLVAMVANSVVIALLAADAGGWAQMWTGDYAGGALTSRFLILLAALVILGTALRLPSLVAVWQGAVALFVLQLWITAPILGETGIAFQPNGPGVVSDGIVQADVIMAYVVALVFAVGAVASTIWLLLYITHRRAPAESQQSTRLRWGVAALCLAFPVVAPRLGHELVLLSQGFLSSSADALNGSSQDAFLMLAIWLLAFAVAVLSRRRSPALTVAACVICAALWGPFLVVTSPFLYSPAAEPFASNELATLLVLWTGLTLVAIAVALSLIARAGEAARESAGVPAEAPVGFGGPPVQA